MKMLFVIQVILFLVYFSSPSLTEKEILSLENEYDKFLLLSTIDGKIHLMNWHTGERVWSTALQPVTKTVGTNGSLLISNPISGRLFIFKNNLNQEVFTSLDQSLYEYVRQTPVFMDGLLMTGSKTDRWISIDLETGNIVHSYQSGDGPRNCPPYESNESKNLFFVGVCQYNLVLSDPTSRGLIYSISLNSLATHAITDSDKNDLRVYSASDSGLVAAKYKLEGLGKGWTYMFNSSVIGFYSFTNHGILSRLQFTSMSHETLARLFLNNFKPSHLTLKKAMFFGQGPDNSWYVMNTYIQQNTLIRSLSRKFLPLITGPSSSSNSSLHYYRKSNPNQLEYNPSPGFYEEPPINEVNPESHYYKHYKVVPSQYLLDFDRKYVNTAVIKSYYEDMEWYKRQRFKQFMYSDYWIVLLMGSVVAIFVMTLSILCILMKKSSKSSSSTDGIAATNNSYNSKQLESNGNEIEIGDLIYYPNDVLGYGTNGTVVFKGLFRGNDKDVAVKRLIKTEQSQYELQFLRQSFDCSYLIKCFYITQSREFTFLALELCDCTMESYVTDVVFRTETGLDKTVALQQMMSGVNFLHDKGIVHRDLKPRNVLLMKQNELRIRNKPEESPQINNNNNKVEWRYKVVISDFGLSRQSLDQGLSITKTGYCTGTTGYMAPELMRDDVKRITISADIFSCGILFYYIHSLGQHPFGSDVLSRQHKIHEGMHCLDQNHVEDQMMMYFIKSMLKTEPNQRPNAEEILKGPLFWKDVEKLSFLCDVSDFLEKADAFMQISMDKLGKDIFKDNWSDVLEEEFLNHLTIQRTYKKQNLSHLVRAIRNKRNHFHELPSSLCKRLFGGTLQGLWQYIDKKYPKLLSILYNWVRRDLASFPCSVTRYYSGINHITSSGLNRQSDVATTSTDTDDSSNTNNCTTATNNNTEDKDDYLEWRRQPKSRRRPNQPKKQRGKSQKTKSNISNVI